MMLLMLMVGGGLAVLVTAILILRRRTSAEPLGARWSLGSLSDDAERSGHPSAQTLEGVERTHAPSAPGYLVEWSIRRKHPAEGRPEQDEG
jgi:hypothetical protein